MRNLFPSALAILAVTLFFFPCGECPARDTEQAVTFEIRGFMVEGNSLLPENDVYKALVGFAGPDKTAETVEEARNRLESLYHKRGYPAVLVNIPEQTVEEGIVELQVIEARIRRVRVTGNRYFTMARIKAALPSIAPGRILWVPQVQQELAKLNRNPDLKVSPILIPGRDPGTIDVELKVKDKLPLHGSLELNNRNTHDTSSLRLNGMIRYDNLWQKEHSFSLQYQTSPLELDEVQVVAGSYVLPVPWNTDHLLALYAVVSDSQTAFGEGFNVVGKGSLYGLRYVAPLPAQGNYSHNLTLGLDYKDFHEALGFEQDNGIMTPMTYMPFSAAYNSSLPDSTGMTRFSGSVNFAIRGLVSDPREFEIKRFQGRANYLYATLGVERMQKLPAGLGLFAKLDGQISDQPLISNEQYAAGGMESVRGYKESEVLGDNAIHGTLEFSGPDLFSACNLWKRAVLQPYVFFDFAELRIKDALPEQQAGYSIKGTGAGVRGTFFNRFDYQADWAFALDDTEQVEKGDYEIHFMVKARF